MENGNLKVQICNNRRPHQKMFMHLRVQRLTFEEFLSNCSAPLQIVAKRVFDSSGEEIFDTSQLIANHEYQISAGEEYLRPITHETYSTIILPREVPFHLALMGAAAVGKSNVTLRYVKNEIYETYDPTLMDTHEKRVSIDDKVYLVNIYDTCGSENYQALRTQLMNNKDGLIFVYAINSIDSFKEVQDLLQLYRDMQKSPNRPTVVAVVGNKYDLADQRQIQPEDGQKLANEYDALFFETSAMTAHNIDLLFVSVLKRLQKSREQLTQRSSKIIASEESCLAKCSLC